MKYVLALIMIGLGTLMITKTEGLIENFGTSEWAESKFGTSGGTRTMYKLIGLIIIFLSLMGLTGQLGGFVMAIFGGLFGVKN